MIYFRCKRCEHEFTSKESYTHITVTLMPENTREDWFLCVDCYIDVTEEIITHDLCDRGEYEQ